MTYTLTVPIRETAGFASMLIEDVLPQGMEFVSTTDTVTITDEAERDIKSTGILSLAGDTLTWSLGARISELTNHTVTIQFDAKVSDTQTIDTLVSYVQNQGIGNDAHVTFNGNPDSSSLSNTANIIMASDVPTISKPVNKANYYNMKSNDDALVFEVKVPLPVEIANYHSLAISDAFEPAFLISPSDINLFAITYNPDGSEARRDTLRKAAVGADAQQYLLSNNDGAWTATFVEGFDFTELSGMTLLLQVNASLDRNYDLSSYIDPDGIVRIENTARTLVNTETVVSNTVSVTPPAAPVLYKLVNGVPELRLTSGDLDGAFAYEIVTSIPFNTAGFKVIEIRDVLPRYLQLQPGTIEVFVDGMRTAAVTAAYDTDTHALTAVLDVVSIPAFSGSDITIRFVAGIDQTSLTSADRIDNTAEVLLNGIRTSSSTASILPTAGKATLTKQLEQLAAWPPEGKAVFNLERYVEPSYVLIDGQITATSSAPLSLGNLIVGTYRLTEITAPDGYIVAPPVIFEVTGVAPAGETEENVQLLIADSQEPSIAKSTDKTYLNDFEDIVTYTIDANVHSILGMTELLIEDPLSSQYKLLSAEATVVGSGDALTDYLTYDAAAHRIRLLLPNSALPLVEHDIIRLTIRTALKDGFRYELLPQTIRAEGIPNYATLMYNADSSTLIRSDAAHVLIPVGSITLLKTGDGLPLANGLAATFDLHKVVNGTDSEGNTESCWVTMRPSMVLLRSTTWSPAVTTLWKRNLRRVTDWTMSPSIRSPSPSIPAAQTSLPRCRPAL